MERGQEEGERTLEEGGGYMIEELEGGLYVTHERLRAVARKVLAYDDAQQLDLLRMGRHCVCTTLSSPL